MFNKYVLSFSLNADERGHDYLLLNNANLPLETFNILVKKMETGFKLYTGLFGKKLTGEVHCGK